MPDTCLTPAPPAPPVPVPYPNIAQLAATNGASTKVLVENKETVVVGSKVPNSSGDEAGSNGGVVSGMCTASPGGRTARSAAFAIVSRNRASDAIAHDAPGATGGRS